MKRNQRARLSLEGVAVGDTFGETFFGDPEDAIARITARRLRPPPWRYTDDTEMAMSIVECLVRDGGIEQDTLAQTFARRMEAGRGYGRGAYEILTGILAGGSWRRLSPSGFRGGSFGNGAAMRVAPLGAFFADDAIEIIAAQARLSAEVTHAHPEGVAGAIAVAVATALAWRAREGLDIGWLRAVRDAVPAGYTRDAIDEAVVLTPDTSIVDAARALGNGSGVTAPDTVPLCLWVCAHHGHDFEHALWTTVRALGDRDTTCAIVGGILAVRAGYEGIPRTWRESREKLPVLESEHL